ncbi:tetratricopeptide repeat protein [Mucilaginibacter sp. L3T2-6]|uniref:tetratricopeptide repeat protein n=1 Tax=Mucilaginibacter sp. L3T2-6 TaxID=3062491 RepID=UPI002675C8F0|nr:tetratricopeptide repeat protein [Mucilaginibacter sp. L3T2-6]MDO3640979.1 tetratricopeptide repeat protein [Mucilaginibacter sp. L3T2-6]MDV6213545.1 tetratricopeptide repeat protein [Mucilaginibacter sp. L3T2-6]
MKSICVSLLFLFTAFTAIGQQSGKIDDAQLMDYFQSQRYTDALEYLRKTFPEPVQDIKILSRLGYVAQLANKLPDAEGYYQRAFQLDTTNQTVLYNMAGINIRRGNASKAEMYYTMYLARDTTNISVYSHLGNIAASRHDTINAVKFFAKANSLNPLDADVASELGDYYTSLKRFDEALKVLNTATANDPENVVLLLSLMKLNYAQKKWTETVEDCNKLMALGIVNGEILNKLGISYYNLKNYSCGAESFALIDGSNQNEYTYYYAALCYKGLNDQRLCIEMLDKSISEGISPNIATYYGEIADSHEKLLQHKKAALAYQKALQFSESPTLYYLLASLYDSKLKDKKKALAYYRKYLASRPSAKQQAYITYTKSRIEQLSNN